MAPNEGRAKLDLKPKTGGDSPYLQQQNYSLAALAKRDAQADPFAPNTPSLPPASDVPVVPDEEKLAAISQRFDLALKAAYREAA